MSLFKLKLLEVHVNISRFLMYVYIFLPCVMTYTDYLHQVHVTLDSIVIIKYDTFLLHDGYDQIERSIGRSFSVGQYMRAKPRVLDDFRSFFTSNIIST
jgi:hypothetical protein